MDKETINILLRIIICQLGFVAGILTSLLIKIS